MKILAVDDHEEVTKRLDRALSQEGHHVTVCHTGEEAMERCRDESYHVIVLDIGLPGMDGFQVLESLRQEGVVTPVIMLTGRNTEEATVQGLSLGADDYVSKPFSIRELLARVRAAHRRASWGNEAHRTLEHLELDLEARTAASGGTVINLTEKEFALIWHLSQEPLRPWPKESLLREVWHIDFDPGTKVMDVHLSNLRRKLSKLESVRIELVPEEGYRLRVDSSE